MTDIMNIIKTAFENLQQQNRFFVSEADFQCSLAMEIKNELKEQNIANAQVILEFPVIINENKIEHKIYIDIMVVVGDKMYPIELKYKTLKLNFKGNTKSDKKYQNTDIPITDILENQGAQDLGCYGFWRDVNRIETLIQDYDNVSSGVCIFITNDEYYFNSEKHKKETNADMFRIDENTPHTKIREWKKNTQSNSNFPPLTMKQDDYGFRWQAFCKYSEANYDNCEFQYLFVETNKYSQ